MPVLLMSVQQTTWDKLREQRSEWLCFLQGAAEAQRQRKAKAAACVARLRNLKAAQGFAAWRDHMSHRKASSQSASFLPFIMQEKTCHESPLAEEVLQKFQPVTSWTDCGSPAHDRLEASAASHESQQKLRPIEFIPANQKLFELS